AEGLSSLLERLPIGRIGILRVDQHGNGCGVGVEQFQELQTFWDQLGVDERYTGNVAARPTEARDESGLHRVAAVREYDGNGRGRGLRGEGGDHAAGGEDDIDAASDQVGCERRQPVIAKIRPAVFDEEILFLNETRL